MRFVLERMSEPDIEPVTLAEMRTHLRCIEGVTEEDDYISGLISVAREWVETYTGKAFIDQSWRLSIDHDLYLPPGAAVASGNRVSGPVTWTRYGEIYLRRSPAIAITSFVSVDAAGEETEIDPASYEIREPKGKWPRVKALNGATWATGQFRITYRAGFAERIGSPQFAGEVVPATFKHAIKMIVSNFYENREPVANVATSEMPFSVTWLLKPHQSSLGLA